VGTDYELQLKDMINYIKETEQPIFLFGSKAMAEISIIVIRHLGKTVAGICDNNQNVWGEKIQDIEISSSEILKGIKEPLIIACTFNEDTYQMLVKQLEGINSSIVRSDFLLYYYQFNVMKREINTSDLANSMRIISNEKDYLVLNTVSVMLTDKCTLKCKNCASLIEYIKSPKFFDKNIIIESMKSLAEAVDAIEVLTMFGGEPLLHPDLVEICHEASKIKNVKRIQIVTNGTLVLNEREMTELSKYVTVMTVSNYGVLSNKKYDLYLEGKRTNLIVEITEEDLQWSDIGNLKAHNRSDEENEELFKHCNRRVTCPIIINGEYHLCCMSAAGTDKGLIPKSIEDYIDLLDKDIQIQERRDSLKVLLNERKKIRACDYCEIVLNNIVPAALQN